MGKYPRHRRTAAQQAALKAISQRSLVKVEAVAFYDAINGLPPDAPTPTEDGRERGRHYRKCHEYARVAWECFRNGTRPSWKIGRNAIYRRFEAKLKQIGATYLSTLTSGTTTQTDSQPMPTPVATTVRVKPKREAPSVVAPAHERCVLCDEPIKSGSHCDACKRRLGDYAKLLADGKVRTPAEIIDALADEIFDDEDGLARDLRTDPRFVEKDDRWTVTAEVRLKGLNTRKAS
jgi:hypothetical protein